MIYKVATIYIGQPDELHYNQSVKTNDVLRFFNYLHVVCILNNDWAVKMIKKSWNNRIRLKTLVENLGHIILNQLK